MNRPEEHPTRLVYELLNAHDDTARPTGGSALDERLVHLCYLRDLQRRGREALARAAGESA